MISMNRERLMADAKALALSLAENYAPGAPRQDIKVGGDSTYRAAEDWVCTWRARATTSPSTIRVVGEKLAYVLSGGRSTGEQTVSEQYLLDLEREAFLSLCGHAGNAGADAAHAENGEAAAGISGGVQICKKL